MNIASEVLTIWDFILLPFLFLFIFVLSNSYQKRMEPLNPAYQFFNLALFFKLFLGLFLLLIYIFYYGGGDTTEYFKSSKMLANLIFKYPKVGFSILFGNTSPENFSYFDLSTGYPTYYSKPGSYAFVRFITPFVILSFQKFFVVLILLNLFFFIGIWKFYLMVCELYLRLYKQMAIAVLFIPSVVFWSSGVLKDTFTFSATLWFIYNIYMVFIRTKKIIPNMAMLLLNIYILVMLKPYIFVALLPSAILWVFMNRIKNIENRVVKLYVTPLLLLLGIGTGIVIFSSIKSNLGYYGSMDAILSKAQITQQDLIRPEEYGENFYDVGKFDNSFLGIVSKVPVALAAGFFRPFIWESKNMLMIISGIENLFFLLVFLYVLLKTGILRMYKFILSDPFLFFSFSFTLIFSFAVGLSSANFGALVRYRIPSIPFFVIFLFVLLARINEERKSV